MHLFSATIYEHCRILLHNFQPKNYIHRDLKPSNILLGDDMRAKVGDFGLVKIAPDPNRTPSVESQPLGTRGYIAPEYVLDTSNRSTKLDVYAFGVILVGLISGRRALDVPPGETKTRPGEPKTLMVEWFRKKIIDKASLREVIDQTLKPDDGKEETIYKVAKLARRCIAVEPRGRPDMGEVVKILTEIVRSFAPSGNGSFSVIVRDNSGPSGVGRLFSGDSSGSGGIGSLTTIPEDRSGQNGIENLSIIVEDRSWPAIGAANWKAEDPDPKRIGKEIAEDSRRSPSTFPMKHLPKISWKDSYIDTG